MPSLEQKPQESRSEKKGTPVIAGKWVDGKFVEVPVSEISRDTSGDLPVEPSVEIGDPSTRAALKLEQDVTAAQERLSLEKANLEKVTKGGVGAATVIGKIGEKFLASHETKKERAEQSVVQAEHSLDVNRTAKDALEQAGSIENASALLEAKEAEMAKKVRKIFGMLEFAKKNNLDLAKLGEERAKLAEFMQTYADAREKLKSLG